MNDIIYKIKDKSAPDPKIRTGWRKMDLDFISKNKSPALFSRWKIFK